MRKYKYDDERDEPKRGLSGVVVALTACGGVVVVALLLLGLVVVAGREVPRHPPSLPVVKAEAEEAQLIEEVPEGEVKAKAEAEAKAREEARVKAREEAKAEAEAKVKAEKAREEARDEAVRLLEKGTVEALFMMVIHEDKVAKGTLDKILARQKEIALALSRQRQGEAKPQRWTKTNRAKWVDKWSEGEHGKILLKGWGDILNHPSPLYTGIACNGSQTKIYINRKEWKEYTEQTVRNHFMVAAGLLPNKDDTVIQYIDDDSGEVLARFTPRTKGRDVEVVHP
jgi:hypothetical protein